MIIVSKSKILDKKTKQERVCKYSDVPTDEDKWVYDLNYRPIPYDLLKLRFKDQDKSATKPGWWTGIFWKGLRIKKTDKVIAWKRNFDFE